MASRKFNDKLMQCVLGVLIVYVMAAYFFWGVYFSNKESEYSVKQEQLYRLIADSPEKVPVDNYCNDGVYVVADNFGRGDELFLLSRIGGVYMVTSGDGRKAVIKRWFSDDALRDIEMQRGDSVAYDGLVIVSYAMFFMLVLTFVLSLLKVKS